MTWRQTTSENAHCSGSRSLLTGSVDALRGFDFSDYREVTDDNAVVSGVAYLTFVEGEDDPEPELGTVTANENVLVVPISAPARGSGDSTWQIEFQATLEDGTVIVGCGLLKIHDGCEPENGNCGC